MTIQADILIVGAGPAGATLARELPSHLKIILVDARPLDKPDLSRAKMCGGLLAPDAQECLLHMGLCLPSHVLGGPQIFGVRAIDLENNCTRYFQRHYTNLSRTAFEHWLFSMACQQANVQPITADRVYQLERSSAGVTATLQSGTAIKARLVIGADGAHSLVRKQLSCDPFLLGNDAKAPQDQQENRGKSLWTSVQPARNLAVQAIFSQYAHHATFGAFFHKDITHQYAWSIPKNDGLLVGFTMPWPLAEATEDASAKSKLLKLAGLLNQHGFGLGEPTHVEGCALLTPGLGMPFPLGEGPYLLIGEAAGLVSPSSAEGLSYAFTSAMILAKILARSKNIDDGQSVQNAYRAGLSKLLWKLNGKWIKAGVIYTGPVRRAVLASGLGASTKEGMW